TLPSLGRFTVCLWLKERAAEILKYVVNSYVELMLSFSHVGALSLRVGNVFVDLGVSFRDDKWHMLCWSWRSSDGFYKIYLDGATIHASSGYQKGHSVPSGGVLVIGQDQDSLGGGYDAEQSFVGSLSGVNIWQTVLGDDVIQAMSAGCNMWSGDAVSWL
ncbi:predicted protein, partial [Nematostella vectensis]